MAQQKRKVSMPGVAEGMELASVPLDEELSAEEKVNGMLQGSMSEDVYQVSDDFCTLRILSCLIVLVPCFEKPLLYQDSSFILLFPTFLSPSFNRH
jgi:hypothetical protein